MASNIKVDVVRPTATNGSLSLKGDSGGSATTNGVTVDSSGDTSITGTTTVSSLVATTADINGGTIDGTDITVGSGNTLNVSAGTLTLANDQISGDKIHDGTISNFASTGIDDNASSTALTIDASGVVNTTTAKVTNIQATSGQSLTIKDEDGNAAITIGTDNTAHTYLSLNFGSYHGDSGVVGSGTRTGNTLDDYEEGTWTGTVTASTTPPISPSTATGYYTKIGRLVTVRFVDNTINMTGSIGELKITGLPFICRNSSGNAGVGSVVFFDISLPANTKFVSPVVNGGNDFLNFYASLDNASYATVTDNSTTSGRIWCTVTYEV